MKIIVKQQSDKLRLDKFLTERIDKTRSQIKKDIENGLIFVNGKKAKVHQFLNLNDVIESKSITPPDKTTKKIAPTPKITTKLKTLFKKTDGIKEPKIVLKTKDYLVIEKPAGLLVHPTLQNESNTLVHWLIKKFPEVAKVGDTEALKRDDQIFRPSIVHRLDKDVSGLMIIPRNQKSFEYFKSQFKLRKIGKYYLALVYGDVKQENGIIDFEISRSVSSGKMAAHPEGSKKGKPSATEFKVLQRFQKCTLIEARPLTGRTNQIRVHLFAMGNPIVGDELYKLKNIKTKIKLDRVFLHAYKLSFIDPSGEAKSFESALPTELQNILNNFQ